MSEAKKPRGKNSRKRRDFGKVGALNELPPSGASQPLPFKSPTLGDPEFASLPAAVQRDVLVWLNRLGKIWHARPITGAIVRLAHKHRAGYSTILNKYYALRGSNDWRVLISRRLVPTTPLKKRVSIRVALPTHGLRLRIFPSGENEATLFIEIIDRPHP